MIIFAKFHKMVAKVNATAFEKNEGANKNSTVDIQYYVIEVTVFETVEITIFLS